MTLIAQGAEAQIRKEGKKIIKERVKKGYRIEDLDLSLRMQRTRIEARNLVKIAQIIPVPKVLKIDEEHARIEMEYIEGKRVSEVLEKEPFISILKTIGHYIAKLHNNNIIHGDLTTSNFILTPEKKIYCIDLGLSFHSTKVEDKAVDLHLLREALTSKHHTIAKECYDAALREYHKECKNNHEILEQVKKVELRGRNKAKQGS